MPRSWSLRRRDGLKSVLVVMVLALFAAPLTWGANVFTEHFVRDETALNEVASTPYEPPQRDQGVSVSRRGTSRVAGRYVYQEVGERRIHELSGGNPHPAELVPSP